MKRILLKVFLILAVLEICGCSLSPESRFFSKFSMQELVERNKTIAGLVVTAGGGGGSGGGGISTNLWAPGRKRFHSRKVDHFSCWLKPEANNRFDEPALKAALKQDV